MHPKSSQEESWFQGFYWTGRPTLKKHLKMSLPSAIGMWEGPWVLCFSWSANRDTLTRNKVGFPCSGLNLGLCFMSQDKGMSEYSVQSLEKAFCPSLMWNGGLTSIDTSRGPRSSMLQKVMRIASSWKLKEIPISLCKLERDAWFPTSPPEASVLLCQA